MRHLTAQVLYWGVNGGGGGDGLNFLVGINGSYQQVTGFCLVHSTGAQRGSCRLLSHFACTNGDF